MSKTPTPQTEFARVRYSNGIQKELVERLTTALGQTFDSVAEVERNKDHTTLSVSGDVQSVREIVQRSGISDRSIEVFSLDQEPA